MSRILTCCVLLAALMFPSVAAAHDSGSVKHKNSYLRSKMTKLGGDPGCNLVKRKCNKRLNSLTGKKRYDEIRRYFAVMRRAIMPRQAVQHINYGKPLQPPAGTESVNADAGLQAIANCESGGDPTAVSENGTYRGKYQFDYGTWNSVGGVGDPAAASEAEQDKRAAMLKAQRGNQPWPICGQ